MPDSLINLKEGFYIANWYIDPSASIILCDDQQVHLEPKVMDLLVYLAQQPGHVYSRDDLLQNVWHGVIVSDEALTNAIIKIRKAFNDSARHPEFIETLPKRGYRLIAQVKLVQNDETINQQESTLPLTHESGLIKPNQGKLYLYASIALMFIFAGYFVINKEQSNSTDIQTQYESDLYTENPKRSKAVLPSTNSANNIESIDKPSIAVLPFVNTGNEIEHSYFSDGITDDLITDLSKISGLFVISRNSTFPYKGRVVDIKKVAHTLGVRYILEGSIRRSGEKVRVNVQLIDGQTSGHIWSDRYDGTLKDVFTLQDKITSQIISALALTLTDRDQAQLAITETIIPEAYDEFLKGYEYSWRTNRENFARAEKHYRRALEIDPNYSRAHAALALLYLKSWTEMWHENAGSSVAGWVRANEEISASMKNPTTQTYSILSAMNLQNRRFDKAISAAEKAILLDPNSASGYLALADALSFAGQPIQAIENARKALRHDLNFPSPYLFVEGRSLYDLKQYEEAIATLKRAVAANSSSRNSLVALIAAYGQLGKLKEAGRIIEKLNNNFKKDKLPEFTIGWLRNSWPYKNKADKERLFEGLKKARVPEW